MIGKGDLLLLLFFFVLRDLCKEGRAVFTTESFVALSLLPKPCTCPLTARPVFTC